MGRTLAVRRPSATAVASLVRVPNLFTAPPDVVLGAALAAGVGAAGAAVTVSPVSVAGLALASMFLYAGGATLNDAFDAPVDARDRPDRPIPSGEISRGTGFGLGGTFLVLGVAIAVGTNGLVSGAVATLIAGGIVLYDGVLKGDMFGFLVMGTIRGLNVILGLTVVDTLPTSRWLLPPAIVIAYIAAVTYMAASETTGGNRTAIAVVIVATVVSTVAVGAHHVLAVPAVVTAGTGLVLAGGFLLWTGATLRRAYLDPVPGRVGPAVGTCVLALVVLDGAFAAATGIWWAVAATGFLAPAVGLSRIFDVT